MTSTGTHRYGYNKTYHHGYGHVFIVQSNKSGTRWQLNVYRDGHPHCVFFRTFRSADGKKRAIKTGWEILKRKASL